MGWGTTIRVYFSRVHPEDMAELREETARELRTIEDQILVLSANAARPPIPPGERWEVADMAAAVAHAVSLLLEEYREAVWRNRLAGYAADDPCSVDLANE